MATLGNTGVGGTQANSSASFIHGFGPFTATEDGTVTAVNIYSDTGAEHVTFGIYADSAGLPGSLLATSAEVAWNGVPASPAWLTFALSGSITNAGVYWIGLNSERDSWDYHYNASGSAAFQYKSSAYSAGVIANPFGTPDGNLSRDVSIYLTYTPAATNVPISGNAGLGWLKTRGY
jgi:hypothetical protein